MGVLDFLFEGRPPASTTTYGQSIESIPTWLSDYTQGMVGRANVIAAEPYQAYEGPRIAGFTPDQLSGFDLGRENIGSYQPAFGESAGALGEATRGFPGAVDEYMNPYIQNVLDRQAELSGRQLSEQFIPGLQSAFIGSGTFGGERMEELGIRGTRDIMEGLQGQQLASLGAAYGQAGELYGADATRELQAAPQWRALGEAQQRAGITDAATMEAIGAQEQGMTQGSLDLAYRDFLEQREYPKEMVDWMNTVIRGMPTSRATQTTDVGPASVYGPSPLSQMASGYSAWQGLGAPGAGG